jgi:hypothetical protein
MSATIDKPKKTVKAKVTGDKAKVGKIAVSESNLRKTATRVLSHALVSTEIDYLQRVLGNTATQQELDDKVMAVRKMPWSSIVLPE